MTDTTETLVLSATHSGVCTLTLNRPDKLNAFTRAQHAALKAALEFAAKDESVRCVVLTGAGRGFCAGQDLADLDFSPEASHSKQLDELVGEHFNGLIETLLNYPKPLVAAVNGVAAGAGANIALACDIVIASEAASFVQAFIHIGLVPDSGGTFFLPRAVGTANALGLAMLGEKLSAIDAKAMGLIWQCVPAGEFTATVEKLSQKLATMPTAALIATRRAIRQNHLTISDALSLEHKLQVVMGSSYDYNEGVQAFLAKRKPEFKGH